MMVPRLIQMRELMRSADPVAIWLLIMAVLVAGMVLVGGATRLTDSGLSITEWAPITGAIPPLSEAAWLAEFEKYKAIPEYEQVNWGMSLSEFKYIYWWEWGHRFYGRFLGFAFLLPLIYFAMTRRLNRGLGIRLGGLFILGGLQGVIGWWMVSSGLSERVDVSQYRLAAHLGLAVLLFAALIWIALGQLPAAAVHRELEPDRKGVTRLAGVLVIAIYVQVVLGAFVAGLRAGKTFNTWPLMDGKIIPDGYFTGEPRFNDLFETAAAAQFNHRIGAYLVLGLTIWLFLRARRTRLAERARAVLFFVALQVALGIWTVLAATPLSLGLVHQATALALLASAIYCFHGSRTGISINDSSSST